MNNLNDCAIELADVNGCFTGSDDKTRDVQYFKDFLDFLKTKKINIQFYIAGLREDLYIRKVDGIMFRKMYDEFKAYKIVNNLNPDNKLIQLYGAIEDSLSNTKYYYDNSLKDKIFNSIIANYGKYIYFDPFSETVYILQSKVSLIKDEFNYFVPCV